MVWVINDFPKEVNSLLKEVNSVLKNGNNNVSVVYWVSEIRRELVIDFYLKRNSIIQCDKNGKIVLVLNSPGGDIDAAYSLCQILRSKCQYFEIVVPMWAKSAATLLCLAADKILMTPMAELGPLDVQVREPGEVNFKGALDEYQAIMHVRQEAFSTFDHAVRLILHGSGMDIRDILAPAGNFVSNLVSPLYNQIDPVKLGRRARQLDIGYQYALRILKKYGEFEDYSCDLVANKIVYGYPSHSFAINFEELKSLHLNVELIEIHELEVLISILTEMTDNYLVGGFSDGDAYSMSNECVISSEGLDLVKKEAAATHEQADTIIDISKEDTGNGVDL